MVPKPHPDGVHCPGWIGSTPRGGCKLWPSSEVTEDVTIMWTAAVVHLGRLKRGQDPRPHREEAKDKSSSPNFSK